MTEERKKTLIYFWYYTRAVVLKNLSTKRHILCIKATVILCDPKQNKGQLVSSSHTRLVKTLTTADV